MIVKKYIIYRIVPFDAIVKEECPYTQETHEIDGTYKKKIEEALEKHRPENYPQRSNCLFVCFSKENAYEWAYIKYMKQDYTQYKLLTLEITGKLYWFKAECYNLLHEGSSNEQIDKACKEYWNSSIENPTNSVIGKEYEGLFVGNAVVKAIESKIFINGESFDVE